MGPDITSGTDLYELVEVPRSVVAGICCCVKHARVAVGVERSEIAVPISQKAAGDVCEVALLPGVAPVVGKFLDALIGANIVHARVPIQAEPDELTAVW